VAGSETNHPDFAELQLPDYELGELLHNTRERAIYRGWRLSDGKEVFIKKPHGHGPEDRLVRCRNEFELLKRLHLPGVIRAYEVVEHAGFAALVLEYFDPTPLMEWAAATDASLLARINVAIEIAKTLGKVHEAGIIHQSISSQNLLVDRETSQIKLINFAAGTHSVSEGIHADPELIMEGSLAYISPEQTGRINRAIDDRTDWYSFGITLYELFCGQLPFHARDPLEWIHFHVAGETIPLTAVEPGIPPMLSAIVLKLLKRDPEARYQSAAGIVADLNRCADALETGLDVPEFELGTSDVNDRFELPSGIVGRGAELEALNAAFERVTAGAVEIVRIFGLHGSGKTSLAKQLQIPATRHRGFFVRGNCGHHSRDSAFGPLVSALRELVTGLLAESEDTVAIWRERLAHALGDNAQVVVDVIPELEFLLGPQPDAPRLPDDASRMRFQSAFGAFVRALATHSRPLVLFLDEMQWADSATLKLLDLLLNDPAAESLLVIETLEARDESDAKTGSSDAQRTSAVRLTEIDLEPLDDAVTAALIAAALRRTESEVMGLATIVNGKTGGKPLYIREFLRTLHGNGQIWFDHEHDRFEFDLEGASEADTTENVAMLMTRKLEQLDASTQEVLNVAAVIGKRFDIVLLARIMDRSVAEVLELLQPANDAGLLIVVADRTPSQSGDAGARLGRRVHAFSHERLHQAAYRLLGGSERAALHLSIGRELLSQSNEQQLERQLIDVVAHCNEGIDLIESELEKLRISELNLRAAERMRNATAYETARRYYEFAIRFLGHNVWQMYRRQAIDLHSRLVEVMYLAGQLDEALENIVLALRHTRAVGERAHLEALRVAILLRKNDPRLALAAGLRALDSLGVDLSPGDADIEQILQVQMREILQRTDEIGIYSLLTLPQTHDADHIGIMELMRRCLPAAYQTDKNKYGLICCRMIALSLENGNCSWSSGAYGSFAALLSTQLARYRDADKFAKLGVDLATRLGERPLLPEALLLRAMLTSHWVAPIKNSIDLYTSAIETARQYGDRTVFLFATARRLGHLQFRGAPLPAIVKEAGSLIEEFDKTDEAAHVTSVTGQLHLANWLACASEEDDVWLEAEENEITTEVESQDNRPFRAEWCLLLLKKHYLAGDMASAWRYAQAFDRLRSYGRGFVIQSEYAFYASMALAALASGATPEQRAGQLDAIDGHLANLSAWVDLCPPNRIHMKLLVEAERARLNGDTDEAIRCFDAAIAAADEHGFTHIQAIAAERAAAFWRERKKPEFASIYQGRAISTWLEYGALRKVHELRQRLDTQGSTTVDLSRSVTTSLGKPKSSVATVDFAAVIKASHAIAGEIVLEDLLTKLIDIVLECAGGDRIALILPSRDGLMIQGIKEQASGNPKLMLAEPVEKSTKLSRRIVNYVLRTHEHLVLTEPARSRQYQGDSYIQNRRPRSVICAPIMHKNEMAGVIYIENTQIADAFTPARIEALDLLLSQIAISIENAQLYARQDDQAKNIERANAALMNEIGERKRVEKQLSRYRDHLEELVAQRTHELETAYEKLQSEASGREDALRKLEESTEQIRSLAYLDGLTGLPNRRLLNEHLDKILARCKRKNLEFAVLFVDLDNFKLINDSIGHQAADTVLCEFAEALGDLIRSSDVLAAHMENEIDLDATISISPITESVLSRLGGDEFVVLLPEIRDRFAAATVAQRILDRLERPFTIGDSEVFIAASVGIATFPYDGHTAEVLLRNADTAMYHAKELGKATYKYYSDEMNAASVERLTLESGLRRALDDGGLELHYQPQVDVVSGRIVGAEALIRWKDPIRGYISPSTFVPIAESGGLILQIGEWILHEVTRQVMDWRAAGLATVPVSVNVSGTQFRRQDIVALVRHALNKSGLEPEALGIEITETSLMSVLDRAAEVLHQLRALGVKTALDDFGTGYSSLSYLKAFPLDSLKIDRSFIGEMLTDAKTAALTEAIINMTRILDLKVVAEGIESEDQLDYLRELGCGIVQGYFFSPAVPAVEFARLLGAQPAHWRRPPMSGGGSGRLS